MTFWTFIALVVIIMVAGDVVKKLFKGSRTNNEEMTGDKEIEELKARIEKLDNYTKHKIEKRIQAIETIVTDSEYNLEMKFKRVIGDE